MGDVVGETLGDTDTVLVAEIVEAAVNVDDSDASAETDAEADTEADPEGVVVVEPCGDNDAIGVSVEVPEKDGMEDQLA